MLTCSDLLGEVICKPNNLRYLGMLRKIAITLYSLVIAPATMYFGLVEILSLKNVIEGFCLIIIACFYFKGLLLFRRTEMRGLAYITIGSLLLWLLAFNDLVSLGIGIAVRIPGLEGLSPPILLAPLSLILIPIIKHGEWR